jgi:NTP pyrophosphatase (non-canonical NTP hydrolase)
MNNVNSILAEIKDELERVAVWPAMNSAHEGYAVLAEEVDELWDHVKTNQKKRDLEAMRKEAVQVAAMAIRFACEVCNEESGRR